MEERMITVGIDVGSITTEALVYEPQRGVLGYSILLTGGSSYEAASLALEKALIFSGIKRDEVKRIVATGAGRGIVDFAQQKSHGDNLFGPRGSSPLSGSKDRH